MDGRCEKYTEIPAEGTSTTFEDWSVSAMSLQLARYTTLASNFTNKKSKEKRKVLFLVLLLLVFFISESSLKILDQIP